MREEAVELPAVRRAERTGWLSRKLQWIGRVGAPDRFFARCGRIVLIEFKAPGKTPRRSQTLEHDRLRAAGIEVYVCDTVEDALKVLDKPTTLENYRLALEQIAAGANDARAVAREALSLV